ncbi:MAG: HigA family addiction module antidote protein [Bacteroidales bacterium]|nr:HigA family addiction module antidote protein [Bacteroidales bacterium]
METRNEVRPYLPQHPGAILKAELRERGIKQKAFAEEIGMRPSHLSALLNGYRNISPQVAARIEAALQIPAQVWLRLQNNYNLDMLRPCEVVDGPSYKTPAFALAEPSPDEQKLWDLAFRAGQNDAIDKISRNLKKLNLSEEGIRKATSIL